MEGPPDFMFHNRMREMERNDRKNNKKKQEEDDEQDEDLPNIDKSSIFSQSFQYTKREWKLILVINFFSFVPLYLHVREPIIESQFLDAAASQDSEQFKNFIFEYLAIKLINIILNPIQTYLTFLLDQRLSQTLKRELFQHIIHQDFEFFEKYNSGELVNIFNRNLNQIKRQATGQGIINPFKDVIKGASSLWVLFSMNAQITMLLIVILPLYMICDYVFLKVYMRLNEENENQQDKRANVTNEVIQNIMTVKSFGMEEKEFQDFEEFQKQQFQNSLKRNIVVSIETTVHKVLDVLKPIVLFYCSFDMMMQNQQLETFGSDQQTDFSVESEFGDVSHQVGAKRREGKGSTITAGNMSTFMRYSSQILQFYNSIKRLYNQVTMKREEMSLKKIYQILHYKSKVKDEGTVLLEPHQGNIEFQNVQFSYQKRKEQVEVLKNISFKIPHGKYVAFVGMSGAGKTTIIKLIQRFYDIDKGVIKIGDHSIKDIKLESLRKNIGFVSQQLQLFNTNIEKNIAYGCSSYTQEDLEKACEMAGCLEFLNNKVQFPKGLKTKVGERGTKLSGGQMQRLGIARALMKKPSILIFDEATSSLDAEKEYQVQQSIEQLVKNANKTITIILIAHRLSTIVNCEEIFVLKEGDIVEQGNHQQLLANNSVYSELIKRQLSQYSEESKEKRTSSDKQQFTKKQFQKPIKVQYEDDDGQYDYDNSNNDENEELVSHRSLRKKKDQ